MSGENQNLTQLKSATFIKKAIEGLDKNKLIKLKEKIDKVFSDRLSKLEEQEVQEELKKEEIKKALESLKANGISVDDVKNHIN